MLDNNLFQLSSPTTLTVPLMAIRKVRVKIISI